MSIPIRRGQAIWINCCDGRKGGFHVRNVAFNYRNRLSGPTQIYLLLRSDGYGPQHGFIAITKRVMAIAPKRLFVKESGFIFCLPLVARPNRS